MDLDTGQKASDHRQHSRHDWQSQLDVKIVSQAVDHDRVERRVKEQGLECAHSRGIVLADGPQILD
jgi:hypothetical protein